MDLTLLLVTHSSSYTSASHRVPCKATLTEVCTREGINVPGCQVNLQNFSIFVCSAVTSWSHLWVYSIHISFQIMIWRPVKHQTHHTNFVQFMSCVPISKDRWQNQPYSCKLNNMIWDYFTLKEYFTLKRASIFKKKTRCDIRLSKNW